MLSVDLAIIRLYGDLRAWGSSASPTPTVEDLLAEIEATQQAAFKIRPGVNGIEISQRPETVLKKSKLHNHYEFLAHGMGLVSHEARHGSPMPGRCRTTPMTRAAA